MNRKLVLAATLTFVLMGMLGVALKVERVEASGTITIMADGSIVPSTANITSVDNVTYTFTDNINDSLVVERDNTVVDGAGYTVQGTGSGVGIQLYYTSNVTIKNTQVKAFWVGIHLASASNNTISGNNITENSFNGISLMASSGNNKFYHNNIMNNTNQVYWYTALTNVWDDGYPSGGNYWSDYSGVDSDFDGIGDTPYLIDETDQDGYPLMGTFSDFDATSEHHVQTICNSTISAFQFNGTALSFNVTGEDGTVGFCRTCIPRALMNETYQVFVNGTEVPHTLLPCSNSTHSYLYFSYNHSTQEVMIIPEFPSFLILPLFMIATLLAVILYRRKHSM